MGTWRDGKTHAGAFGTVHAHLLVPGRRSGAVDITGALRIKRGTQKVKAETAGKAMGLRHRQNRATSQCIPVVSSHRKTATNISKYRQ